MSRFEREIETNFEVETRSGAVLPMHIHADIGQGGPDEVLVDTGDAAYWLDLDAYLAFADQVARMAALIRQLAAPRQPGPAGEL